jgi:ubiquinone/menaquinone biosynthesis C-methylase UbiE
VRKSPVEKHFDMVAKNYDYGKSRYSYYYGSLKKLLGSIIPKGKKVFEVGCGTGELLVSLKPKQGFGMDISIEMVNIAKAKHSKETEIHFSTKWPEGKFDNIFMCDVIEHLEDPKETFKKIQKIMDKKTIFVCTMANPIWEPVLMIAEKIGLKMKEGPHRRAKIKEYGLWIKESGMKIIDHDYKLLMPVKIPLVTKFINRYIERYLKRFAFIEYFVAKLDCK